MRGKNIIWISIVAMLLGTLTLVPTSKSQTIAHLYITPTMIPADGTLGHVDDQYTLSVNIANATDVWGVQFRVAFAPYVSVLSISNLQEGMFVSEGWWPTFFTYTIDAFHGWADFAIVRLPNPEWPGMKFGANGDGELATFMFTVLEAGISPVTIENVILLDTTGAQMLSTTAGSFYNGSYASFVRILSEPKPNRKYKVGDTFTFKQKVRNDGDVPLYVRVRLDISRVEDQRAIVLRSGQTYLDGGLGEDPSITDYIYVNGYTGSYSGWGWIEEGTAPYLNAIGDGNYVWGPDQTDYTWNETLWYDTVGDGNPADFWYNDYPAGYPIVGKFDFEDFSIPTGRKIDSVNLEAYTRYDYYDEDNDLDTYARPMGDVGPTTWIGSLWGNVLYEWKAPRWVDPDLTSDFFPQLKTQDGINAARVRYVMYWTADDLPHGNAYMDAMRFAIRTVPERWGVEGDANWFVIMPGEVLDLEVITWYDALPSHVGTYQATATIEYTSAFYKVNSWGPKPQKSFIFTISP